MAVLSNKRLEKKNWQLKGKNKSLRWFLKEKKKKEMS
jgi:hypothetical protein